MRICKKYSWYIRIILWDAIFSIFLAPYAHILSCYTSIPLHTLFAMCMDSIILQELHDAFPSIPACYLQTAVTMLYVLHELAKNPDVQARLADEVTGVLGSSPVVTEENIQHLHYLKGCIKESLR